MIHIGVLRASPTEGELTAAGASSYGTKRSGPPEAIAVGMIWNAYSAAEKPAAISASHVRAIRLIAHRQ